MNDDTPGDGSVTNMDLLVAGPFTVQGKCADNLSGSGVDQAVVRVLSAPDGSSFVGLRSDGVATNLVDFFQADVVHVGAFSPISEIGWGTLTVAAVNGEVLDVNASAELHDPAGDCVFAVTAIGP